MVTVRSDVKWTTAATTTTKSIFASKRDAKEFASPYKDSKTFTPSVRPSFGTAKTRSAGRYAALVRLLQPVVVVPLAGIFCSAGPMQFTYPVNGWPGRGLPTSVVGQVRHSAHSNYRKCKQRQPPWSQRIQFRTNEASQLALCMPTTTTTTTCCCYCCSGYLHRYFNWPYDTIN